MRRQIEAVILVLGFVVSPALGAPEREIIERESAAAGFAITADMLVSMLAEECAKRVPPTTLLAQQAYQSWRIRNRAYVMAANEYINRMVEDLRNLSGARKAFNWAVSLSRTAGQNAKVSVENWLKKERTEKESCTAALTAVDRRALDLDNNKEFYPILGSLAERFPEAPPDTAGMLNLSIEVLRQRADAGDTAAQYTVGRKYRLGDTLPQDYRQALVWLTKASKQGHALAQHNLALMHEYGEGTEKNPKEAVSWYRKAAEENVIAAQYNLAVMIANGTGTERDEKEAIQWYTRAASQGDKSAQYNLGSMYYLGRGVERNEAEAIKWFTLAAAQYHWKALGVLAQIEDSKQK